MRVEEEGGGCWKCWRRCESNRRRISKERAEFRQFRGGGRRLRDVDSCKVLERGMCWLNSIMCNVPATSNEPYTIQQVVPFSSSSSSHSILHTSLIIKLKQTRRLGQLVIYILHQQVAGGRGSM